MGALAGGQSASRLGLAGSNEKRISFFYRSVQKFSRTGRFFCYAAVANVKQRAHLAGTSGSVTMTRVKGLTILSLAVLLGSCGKKDAPPPPKPHVTVAKPLVRDVVDWDEYVGRFEAIQDASVKPRVDGTVMRIFFRNGQDVRAGQPLFEIDPRPYRAALMQAQGQVARAAATLANAGTELSRAEKLRAVQAVSQEELEQKSANRRTAAADLQAARAAEATARLNLSFTTVTSPISGRISDKRVSIGDVVSTNTTELTRVVTLDPIWFTFEGAESLYLKYVRQAADGQRGSSRTTPNPVDIQLADETDYAHHAKMVFVDNAIDPRSGTIRTHAELPNKNGMVTPGMFGRARLLGSGTYHAMLIPDEAVVTDQSRKLVYVLDATNKVGPREVETGPMVTGLRVIRKGLGPQDRVLLDGLATMMPGTVVDPTETQLKPRAEDTSPKVSPLSAPPASSATAR